LNAQGHDYTLLLNEAYKVLMRDISRHADGRGRSRVGLGVGYTGDGYSSWNGPVRSQALFVDENKCIGTYPASIFFCFIVEDGYEYTLTTVAHHKRMPGVRASC
jgi:hypothetical protein